jgi:hypothetical protein
LKKICPLTGDECMQHGCEFYTHLIGKDPQTGKDIDNFGCAIAFLPLLLVENAQQQRQTGAAVESFRNNMTKQNEQMLKLTEDGINESIK